MLYICLKIKCQHSWLMKYSQCNKISVTLNNYSNQNTALCKNVIFILYLACTSASPKETIRLRLTFGEIWYRSHAMQILLRHRNSS